MPREIREDKRHVVCQIEAQMKVDLMLQLCGDRILPVQSLNCCNLGRSNLVSESVITYLFQLFHANLKLYIAVFSCYVSVLVFIVSKGNCLACDGG